MKRWIVQFWNGASLKRVVIAEASSRDEAIRAAEASVTPEWYVDGAWLACDQ